MVTDRIWHCKCVLCLRYSSELSLPHHNKGNRARRYGFRGLSDFNHMLVVIAGFATRTNFRKHPEDFQPSVLTPSYCTTRFQSNILGYNGEWVALVLLNTFEFGTSIAIRSHRNSDSKTENVRRCFTYNGRKG